ncbi:MAG TPA: hypothetical protein DCM05_17020 [Elusimicrobia bacterium]|nr:hypothetical protein [Elusimicrobiota bacterium]
MLSPFTAFTKTVSTPRVDPEVGSWRIDEPQRFQLATLPGLVPPEGKTETPRSLGYAPSHSPDIDNINLESILALGFPLPGREPPKDYKLYLKLFEYPKAFSPKDSVLPILKAYHLERLSGSKTLRAFVSRGRNLSVKAGFIDKADRTFTAEHPFPPLVVSKAGQKDFDRRVPFSSLYLTPSVAGVRAFHEELLAAYEKRLKAVDGPEPGKYRYFDDGEALLKVPKEPMVFENWREMPMPADPKRQFLSALLLVYRSEKRASKESPLPAESVLEVGSVVRVP